MLVVWLLLGVVSAVGADDGCADVLRDSATPGKYQGWDYVYVAHADPVAKVAPKFEAAFASGPTDTLALVVGSMACLNALLYSQPKAVLFFDVNDQMITWSKALIAIIRISTSRTDFISRFYARRLDESDGEQL